MEKTDINNTTSSDQMMIVHGKTDVCEGKWGVNGC